MNITYIVIGLIVFIILWLVWTYNGFISLRNRTKEAWSDIDVQLKRRHDLIPNLLESVKGYMAHERGVLESVTNARTATLGAKTQRETQEAENMLTGALKTLFAVSENYPDLKASSNFVELQREIRDTEDKIMAARRFYNNTVMTLNTKIESFPPNLMAKIFKFKQAELFEVEVEGVRETPAVKF
ncbi:MAG: LemA family protein [Candidatus Spechtbacterales bacterium]